MTEIARFGSISAATATFGIGRSSLYLLAAKHPTLLRKFGAKSLVDYGVLQDIVNALPTGASKIRVRKAKPRKFGGDQ
jgi:hypothetical protein